MSTTYVNTLTQVMEDAIKRDLVHHHTEDKQLNGRMITINNKHLLNFGSCSYLGLEQHPALKEGVVNAVQQYGTQFSSSRTYASLGLYRELEGMLEENFGKPTIVTSSTTLGHLATIPVIVEKDDAVILDMQVHSSVQMAVQMLKAEGINISLIRHNDMDMLESKIRQLQNKHQKIWYFADGVYSMYGDYAPLDKLVEFMDKYDQFHLYIDDAHGMSWAGENGCGYVRSQIEHHPKMVLAGSLNKSFATAGGMIVFPNAEMARKVRNCGGTYIFCGPIQPPMLGAAIASVKLHRSDEVKSIQQRLSDLITYTNDRIREMGLPQFMENDSPLFFIPTGLPRISLELVSEIINDGVFVNSASFPATPMKRGGVRFMINGNVTEADIDRLVETIAHHFPLVLAKHGSSPQAVAKTFRIPEFSLSQKNGKLVSLNKRSDEGDLQLMLDESIQNIDPAEWDYFMADRGNFNHSHLQLVESVFTKQEKPENRWDFNYVRIKDKEGLTVLSTFYTTALIKDDMFSPASVSEQIEMERIKDPYFLNSKCVLLGSLITKGDHLYIDREHSEWKQALKLLIGQMQQTVENQNATQLMLREFVKDSDEKLKNELLDLGLTELELLNVCKMDNLNWTDQETYLQSLGSKYRYNVRKEILPFIDKFDVNYSKPKTEEEIRHCYNLYCNVHDGAYALNVHQLPFEYFESICKHPNFDIIRLYLKEPGKSGEERKPVAVMYSFIEGGSYQAMIVGLDYDYVRSLNTYKQMLYLTVMRAKELKCTKVDLAFTAELEKKKVGARPIPTVAYVQIMDFFNHTRIAAYSSGNSVSVSRKAA